ncbi:MAG: YciI family protein [Rhizobiales bacterium]|nr:YciI family protein [Hyphomicrobiales bacterium]MBI3674688.1 YciI family protein [Hyphomicrobiales bacterium]
MAWMIVSEDGPGGAELRRDRVLMDDHWAYEQSIKDRILCAGSLRSDDGVTPIGGLLVLDVETRTEAMALFAADPATRAGLRTNIMVRRWNKAIFAGQVCD